MWGRHFRRNTNRRTQVDANVLNLGKNQTRRLILKVVNEASSLHTD